jgi:hypothetical protein
MNSSNSQCPEEAASEPEKSDHERPDVEKDKAGRSHRGNLCYDE